jgi:hypothetical protein
MYAGMMLVKYSLVSDIKSILPNVSSVTHLLSEDVAL